MQRPRWVARAFSAAMAAVWLLAMTVMSASAGVSATDDTKVIYAGAINSHSCDSTELHFVINQVNSSANAPDGIWVQWTNGAEEIVPLDRVTGGVAHYLTYSNLNLAVSQSATLIYTSWSGQYNLSHGPCISAATATRTPTTSPATATRTATPVPPTATRTSTPLPATATRTSTPLPPTATASVVPPTATRTATTAPGLCTQQQTHQAMLDGKLYAQILSNTASTVTIKIFNTHATCKFEVGAASYTVPDADGYWHEETIGNQVLFAFNDFQLNPGTSQQFVLNMPSCVTQVDVYYGQKITDFDPTFYYNSGYNGQDRKLATDNFNEGTVCNPPTATRTATRTPTTVPPTATPVPATVTRTPTPVPPTATTAGQTIYAQALIDHDCDSTEWHFVINQVASQGQAPASIQVTFANGQTETVPLQTFTGGVAHYRTTSYLNSTVTQASASIYGGWSGQYNLSHGPCGTPPTSTTGPTATRTPTPIGPTATRTATPSATFTATLVPSATRTSTPVPPTVTRTPSPTATVPNTVTINATGTTTYTCTSYGAEAGTFIFVINGLSGPAQAPSSIQVTWDYGAVQTVPLYQVVGGEATYVATNGAWGVTSASAIITGSWSGQFYVREGNCHPIVVPGDTPELGSLALFGSGATSMAGYAYMQLRRRRLRVATVVVTDEETV